MASGVEVSQFTTSHYAAARALWERTPGVGLSDAGEPAAIESFLARNPGLSLVAIAGERMVGTILVGHDGRRGLIHHLAAAARAQRTGIGTRLLREGMSRLRAAGIQKCHLLVFANNASGRGFWEAVGAEHRDSLVIDSLGLS